MNAAKFSTACVLVYDPDQVIRPILLSHLRVLGFGKILESAELPLLRRDIREEHFDLAICTVEPGCCEALDLIKELRACRVGHDPFTPIIVTTHHPTAEFVRATMDSGIDHLIAKPFSFAQVTKGIETLLKQRRKFIRTGNYMGPDRRGDGRVGAHDELVEVPNALKVKAEGRCDRPAEELVQSAVNQLKAARLSRDTKQLGCEIAKIIDGFKQAIAGDIDQAIEFPFDSFKRIADDLTAGAEDLSLPRLGDLAQALITLVSHMRHLSAEEVREVHINLLREAYLAIHQAVFRDSGDSAAVETTDEMSAA